MFLERRYEDGVALMRPFHERLPDDLDVTHQLGLHLYRSGEQQLAVPLLEAASADPRRFDASWLLLQHYYRQANWQAGLVHAERYLEARPDDTEALALIGTYFLKAEQFERAIATLDRYLEREPKNVSARINRANALFRSGDVERAGREYEELLAEEPDKARFLYNLASVRMRQGRCEEALPLLERFLKKEPKNGPALYFRADCMLKLGRFEQAQRAFEQAGVDGQSRNPWVWYGLSRVALEQGQVDKATDHAIQATQLGPEEAELASWLGRVHRKAQRYVDALRWHDKALSLGEAATYHAERGYDLWALT
ncbi:MAG TPA: tetratricopeptide repeat protein, partial [Myxococcota bacterium]|nr:tetratricopeptide repeat protein [Myxococcota bacterium]